MLEGLWITRFVSPPPEPHGILSGVVVIESGRILGGDSGFLYLGQIEAKSPVGWPVSVRIKRHDARVASIFGDVDEYTLAGQIIADSDMAQGQLMIVLGRDGENEIVVSLTKAADLP